jgi:ATP-dependent Clp protease ATP-binding subunit ClpA
VRGSGDDAVLATTRPSPARLPLTPRLPHVRKGQLPECDERSRSFQRERAGGARPAEPFLAAGALAERGVRIGREYVGTEHVLLALTEDATTGAARALAALELTADVVRRDIERILGPCIEPRNRPIDAKALATLGIDLDEVTSRIEETSDPVPSTGHDSVPPAPARGGGDASLRGSRRRSRSPSRRQGDGPLRSEHLLVSFAAVED